MESIPKITEDVSTGIRNIRIPQEIYLEDLFNHPKCPDFLKSVIKDAIPWILRGEFKVTNALYSSRIDPRFAAALFAMDAQIELDAKTSVHVSEIANRSPKSIKALIVPIPEANIKFGSSSVSMTPKDMPVVSATAMIVEESGSITRARIALTGAWREPVRLAKSAEGLLGNPLTSETINSTAQAAMKEAEPVSDYRGSEEYRRQMVFVVCRRALEQCL